MWYTQPTLDNENLGLLRQARHVREARGPTTSTTSHEALLRLPMNGLCADVARLALCVLCALFVHDRDGSLVFFVGVVLFRVVAAVNFLADLLVAAAPVVVLASGIAVPGFAPHTTRGLVGQWRGADGAISDDHLGGERLRGSRRWFLFCFFCGTNT